jgi:hypothetical protein
MRVLFKEEVSRISYLAKYDRSKTFNENLLEQVIGAPNQGMIDVQSMRDFLKDPHKVLTALSIGLTILGAIPSPASPILLALGTAADVADAVLYFNEGDTHMGTIMLALSVIPGGEFIKIFKNTLPLGPFKTLIKKAKEGFETLTKYEKSQLKKYFDTFTKKSDEVGKIFTYSAANKLIKKLPNLLAKIPVASSLYVILFILKSMKFLTVLTVKIGTTVIAADAAYYLFFGNTIERAVNINKVKKLWDLINKHYKGGSMEVKSANARQDINKQLLKQMEDPKIQEAFNQQFNNDFNMEELLKVMEDQGVDTTSTQ